jgi:hypothetical protein
MKDGKQTVITGALIMSTLLMSHTVVAAAGQTIDDVQYFTEQGQARLAPVKSLAILNDQTIKVPCSTAALISSISAANAAGKGKLRLASSCMYTFTAPASVDTALPPITGDISILGGFDTRLSRSSSAPSFRIFDVVSGAKLHLEGVTLDGGAIAGLGGGIRNAGTLELHKVIFKANLAANGGGVANLAGATAKINLCQFISNSTTSVGGGAMINFGTLNLYSSIVFNNTAPINGGGINTQPSGDTSIVLSKLTGNTSGSLGGAISNLGKTSISASTITSNTGSAGGAIATGNSNVDIFLSIIKNNQPDNCNPVNSISGCKD